MMERDRANKAVAIQSGGEREWSRPMYRKQRNFVTMLNKTKKKMYHHKIISNIDSKTMRNVINQLMGESGRSTPSFLEAEGHFIPKPDEIANYLSVYFSAKVLK